MLLVTMLALIAVLVAVLIGVAMWRGRPSDEQLAAFDPVLRGELDAEPVRGETWPRS